MDALSSLLVYGDVGLLALRVVIAAIFLYHCRSKLGNLASFMGFIGTAELLGGLAVLTGFLTQLAAVGLSIIMLGAIWKKTTEWHMPFSAMDKTGWEFDLMILAGCIALITNGAGQYALDASVTLF